jgi:hypothetical protein
LSASLADIWRQADDRRPGGRPAAGRVVAQLDSFSYRILAGEIHGHQTLVDDRHLVTRSAVDRGIERPAAEQAHADGVEVTGTDAQHCDCCGLVARGCGFPVNRELAAGSALQRLVRGCRGAYERPDGGQPLVDAPEDRHFILRRRILSRRQND